MFELEYLLLILGMGVVTYIPRWIPLVALVGRKLPRWMVEWLDLVPVAILASLLLPLLLVSEDSGRIELFRPELLAAVPTIIFALKIKSLSGTVVLGMLVFWLLGNLL